MRILIAVASRHGSTLEMAEAIGTRLRDVGHDAVATSVTEVHDLSGYDAFVVGSATYRGRWLPDATTFVRRNAAVLASQPTWLFSSGPLSDEPIDEQRDEQLIAAEPREIAELAELVGARGHRVFFGALDPNALGVRDRAFRAIPFVSAGLRAGDFRDLNDLEAWADRIDRELGWDPNTEPGRRPDQEVR